MADASTENDENEDCLIREGKHVMLRLNKNLKIILVQRDRKVFIEKLRFVINEAIGCTFGSVFEVKSNKLRKVNPEEHVDELRTADNEDKGRVYQAITTDGSAQKLSKDDVVSLKAQGATAKDIVDQLVENSATFNDRTEFSKAKYRNKKAKKHSARITILQPSTALIAEMYYNSKVSYKVCDLRPDALSQILTLANIRASSNVIVMEQCQGLVVGAVLERMGGYGDIIQIHPGDFPTRIGLDYFNFQPEVLKAVHGFPLCKINSLKEPSQEIEPMEVFEEPAEEDQSNDAQVTEKSSEGHGEQLERKLNTKEKIARRNKRRQEETFVRNMLQSRNMDGLVIVCKFHPSPIVLSLLDYVAPSRPVVVYSQYKEPLVECYNDLRNRGSVVNLQLTETWWRHYQVLPGRTHPLVNMDGSGGYLLSGITVEATSSSNTSSGRGTTVSSSTTTHSSPEKQKTSRSLTQLDTTMEPPAKKLKEESETID